VLHVPDVVECYLAFAKDHAEQQARGRQKKNLKFPGDRPVSDWLDESQLEGLRRELTGMSDASLATTYETYRIACVLREDGIP